MGYLRETQRVDLAHVRDISRRVTTDALLIDPVTLRHLNVIEGVDGGRAGSLLDALDRTMTSMGGRLLRSWLIRPLVNLARIRRDVGRDSLAGITLTDREEKHGFNRVVAADARIVFKNI